VLLTENRRRPARSVLALAGLMLLSLAFWPEAGHADSSTDRRKVKPARAKRTTRPAHPKGRCRHNDIFCTTQVVRLDGSGGEQQGLSEEQVERVITGNRRRLETCLVQARRRDPKLLRARLEFVVTGQGQVLASRVDGRRGTPLARCLQKELRGVHFPRFALKRTVAAVTLAVPQ
jgi:hypothetical protein